MKRFALRATKSSVCLLLFSLEADDHLNVFKSFDVLLEFRMRAYVDFPFWVCLTRVQVVLFDFVEVKLSVKVVICFIEGSVHYPHVWFFLFTAVEFRFLNGELSGGEALEFSSVTRLVEIRVRNLVSAVSIALLPVDIWQGNLKGPWLDERPILLLDPVNVFITLYQFD